MDDKIKSRILSKLERASQQGKTLSFSLKVDDENIVSDTIKLETYEVEALKDLIEEGNMNFFYALSDFSKSIKKVIHDKSKEIAWKKMEENK